MSGRTVEACLDRAAAALAAAGIDRARTEARLLLAHCLGEPTERLIAYPERVVEPPAGFDAAVARRAARVPMAQILGRREFWGLPFEVTADTLDPRPDSETLVEATLERIADRTAPLTIADLGTGIGCLLLSLLSELPAAQGVGVDRSAAALRVFRRNTAALGLQDRADAVQADWCDALAGPFDVVVSNPPYIETPELDGLSPEVARHEPRLALDGGADGLQAYRRLADALGGLLRPTGFAVLELGDGQAPAVSAECIKRDLTVTGYRSDLASRIRCLIVTVKGPENQKNTWKAAAERLAWGGAGSGA